MSNNSSGTDKDGNKPTSSDEESLANNNLSRPPSLDVEKIEQPPAPERQRANKDSTRNAPH